MVNVTVSSVVTLLLRQSRTKRHKVKRKIHKLNSVQVSHTSSAYRQRAGISIHAHLDSSPKVHVTVRNHQDVSALELINLAHQLKDLAVTGELRELKLRIPWHLLIGTREKSNIVLVGRIDSLTFAFDNKSIGVHEIKTHDCVSTVGKPLISHNALLCHTLQVQIYALMFDVFLKCMTHNSTDIKACYTKTGHPETLLFSNTVAELMYPSQTLDDLFNQLVHVVQHYFIESQITQLRVVHLSQSLTRRAIALQQRTVTSYETNVKKDWKILREQLATISI